MLKIQNKTTKRIRIIQIIAFMILILLTSQPFLRGTVDGKTLEYFSALKMISFIGARDANGQYLSEIGTPAIAFLAFLILPVIALMFQIFDFNYNIKNVVGFIASFLGVVCIIYFVGPAYLASGSLLTLIMYIFTAFMSVMGMMARYLQTNKE